MLYFWLDQNLGGGSMGLTRDAVPFCLVRKGPAIGDVRL